jgi:altronate dehydratase
VNQRAQRRRKVRPDGWGPQILRLNPKDNVVVALKPLRPGDRVRVDGVDVNVAEPIPFGHKLALVAITKGQDVIKYGEIIGRATAPIEPGRHVHVHNLKSARLPGGI